MIKTRSSKIFEANKIIISALKWVRVIGNFLKFMRFLEIYLRSILSDWCLVSDYLSECYLGRVWFVYSYLQYFVLVPRESTDERPAQIMENFVDYWKNYEYLWKQKPSLVVSWLWLSAKCRRKEKDASPQVSQHSQHSSSLLKKYFRHLVEKVNVDYKDYNDDDDEC